MQHGQVLGTDTTPCLLDKSTQAFPHAAEKVEPSFEVGDVALDAGAEVAEDSKDAVGLAHIQNAHSRILAESNSLQAHRLPVINIVDG